MPRKRQAADGYHSYGTQLYIRQEARLAILPYFNQLVLTSTAFSTSQGISVPHLC